MTKSVLQKLVEMRGIETRYVDAWGKPATIAESSKAKLLNVLGYDTSDDAHIENHLTKDARELWLSPLNPVQVNRENDNIHFTVRLPIDLVNDTYTLHVTTESGEEFTHTFSPVDEELAQVAQFDDVEFQEYIVALPLVLPLGYHSATLMADDEDPIGTMRLILAPQSCYTPDSIKGGKKIWGLSVQLYCVRSESNWGIGDFTDLARLIRSSAQVGADFVGLNPIHALYPANPDACSPYGPSSRRWLNFLYLDVSAIEGFDDAPVQALVQSDEFQARLAEVRQAEHVDYAGVAALKLQALELVFDSYNKQYLTKNTKENRRFKDFVKEGGESLDMLATYDALQESLKNDGKPSWGWPVFPEKFKDYYNDAVATFAKKHAKRVKFYLFLQWMAAKQLDEASQVAQDSGMTIGLYRDLAVGVSEGSAEIWGFDMICLKTGRYCARLAKKRF